MSFRHGCQNQFPEVASEHQKVAQIPEVPLKSVQIICRKVALVTSESIKKSPNWTTKSRFGNAAIRDPKMPKDRR